MDTQGNEEKLLSFQTEHTCNVKNVINEDFNKFITQDLTRTSQEHNNADEKTDLKGTENSSRMSVDSETVKKLSVEEQSPIAPQNFEENHPHKIIADSGIVGDLSETLQSVDLSSSSELCDTLKTDLSSDSLVTPNQESGSSDFENSNGHLDRPDSLSLFDPLQAVAKTIADSELHFSRMASKKSHPIPVDLKKKQGSVDSSELSQSLPHGTIMRKGEMIEFVAEGLQEKIRMSSPLSRTESSSSRRSSVRSLASTASSTSMATSMSGMSRSPSSQFQQSPEDIPPIDPFILSELEIQAQRVADCLDLMMGNLKNNLHKVSAITVGCLDANKMSVDSTCDSVDSSIKAMYALMAKCEELTKSMQPIYKIADQIKEIKRLLDHFEEKLMDKT